MLQVRKFNANHFEHYIDFYFHYNIRFLVNIIKRRRSGKLRCFSTTRLHMKERMHDLRKRG